MSKPPTVFLGEMTNPEVEAFLEKHHTVIVPTGATEQHGPHGPLLTDVLIPQEIARRIAPQSAPSSRRRSTTRCRIRTSASPASSTSAFLRSWRSSRTCARRLPRRVQAHHLSERPLRQHLRDRLRLRQRRRSGCRKDVKAFPVNYWDALTPSEIAEFSGLKNGLHANLAETSAVMAINPELVDLEKANAEFPPFPEFTVPTGAGAHARSSSRAPGSVHWATKSGTWGDARGSTPEWVNATCRPASARRWPCSRTSRRRSPRCRADDELRDAILRLFR